MISRRTVVMLLFVSAVPIQAQSPSDTIPKIKSLVREKRYTEAFQAAQSALRSAPKDPSLWTLEGIVLSLEGQNERALAAFEQARKIAPDDAAALRGEAELLYKSHDHSERAVPILRRILAIAPRDETAHEMLGDIEQKAGNCPAAIQEFEASDAVIAKHPASLEAFGSCLDETGKPQQAVAVFQQLSNSFPQLPVAKYDLALTLFDAKQDQDARNVIDSLLTTDPLDPDVLSLASEIHEATGDTPKAVEMLRQAIVIQPSNSNLYNQFAMLCFDHDSFQVGIDMIDVGLSRNPRDASLYLSRGLLYAQLSDFGKAESDFETAARLNPGQNLPSYAIDLAELEKYHFDASHSEQAIADLRKQVKLHPDSPHQLYLLAKLLYGTASGTDTASLGEAKTYALKSISLEPAYVPAHNILAHIYLRSGDYAKAEEQCRAALAYDPTNKSAIYQLIMVLRHLGKPDDRAELQSLVKHLSTLERDSMQQETAKNKFRLVEQQTPPSE